VSDVLTLLRELVRIPSVNPLSDPSGGTETGEGQVAEFILEYLREAHIDCSLQEVLPGRPNVIGVLEGTGKRVMAFEAHTDTVPADNMEFDPFDPGDDAKVVRGRGSCDDKASLAAMLTALKQAAGHGQPRCGCVFAATVDEEHQFRGVQKLLEEGLPLPVEGAVVGEPTQLQVICAHKGGVRLRITTFGKAVHSSEPDQGDNAIYHAAQLVQALEGHARALRQRPPHPLLGTPTLSVTIIRGGTAINVVPDRCAVEVDRRVVPGEEPEQVVAELKQVVEACVARRFAYEIQQLLVGGGMQTSQDAWIVGRCLKAVEAVRGSAEVRGVPFGSNASQFAAAGIPAVVLGPGDIAQAHTPTEFVEATQVEQAAEVYLRVIEGE